MGSIITVSQLNRYVKSLFESDCKLKDIYIKGEISNFVDHYKSGHFYFTLKESDCAIKAVMFASYAERLRFKPTNGMSVIVRASVNIYERDGTYQIYVYEMQPEGKGDLQVAFEQLYQKLESEGYFSQKHKVTLPPFPDSIGIITSETGAALQDMLSIISAKYPIAQIILYPALVQGAEAPLSIVKGIKAMNRLKACDVIIIGRGGGSIEDLWAFNSEHVVKAVYESKIPTISAVGHETDYTLCDYTADVRAATPSVAAEMSVPNLDDIKYTLARYESVMEQDFLDFLSHKEESFKNILNRECFRNPAHFLNSYTEKLKHLKQILQMDMKNIIESKEKELNKRKAVFDVLSSIVSLESGYSITKNEDNKVINSVKEVRESDLIHSIFSDGIITSKVVKIEYKK